MTATYTDDMTVEQALEHFFEAAGFGRETYEDRWVRLPIGPVTLRMPNPRARKEVVPLHDVNHVVTGYETNWPGEMEITGYELGRGLGRYWFGWLIDLQAIWVGMTLWPKRTVRAFARGRRARSLYVEYPYDEHLLSTRVGDLRAQLEVADPKAVRVTGRDLFALAGRLLLSLVVHSPILVPATLGLYWLLVH